MGNTCCNNKLFPSSTAAASSSSPAPMRDWTQAVTLFRQGVAGHPTIDDRYTFEREIGRGDFCVVWLAISKKTTATADGGAARAGEEAGRRMACKTIPLRILEPPQVVESLRRELSIMASLPRHPSVARLHEVYEEEEALHLVMDLCDGGSLLDRITNRQVRLAEDEAAKVARAVVEAVRVLHAAGVVHRDLRPGSFMFSGCRGEQEQVKLTDFGCATCFNPGETFAADAVGSYQYMAPEVFAGSYGPEADVWSAGVIIYQLLYGRHPPFPPASDDDDTYEAQKQATLRGAADMWRRRHPWPPLAVSGGAKSLVLAMLEPDPTRRPTALQLLEHPWLMAPPAPATA
ncbi:unnamed protein product [Urochloa humidicola]